MNKKFPLKWFTIGWLSGVGVLFFGTIMVVGVGLV